MNLRHCMGWCCSTFSKIIRRVVSRGTGTTLPNTVLLIMSNSRSKVILLYWCNVIIYHLSFWMCDMYKNTVFMCGRYSWRLQKQLSNAVYTTKRMMSKMMMMSYIYICARFEVEVILTIVPRLSTCGGLLLSMWDLYPWWHVTSCSEQSGGELLLSTRLLCWRWSMSYASVKGITWHSKEKKLVSD